MGEYTNDADHEVPAHVGTEVQKAADALLNLAVANPILAGQLTRMVELLAREAARTPRFASALSRAWIAPAVDTEDTGERRRSTRARNRRAPGVLDPFAIFAEQDERGLREALGSLELEQLRDIVAEHGMDHDRLAMKWKDPQRVIERIVDRVAARIAKGSAFRGRQSEGDAGS